MRGSQWVGVASASSRNAIARSTSSPIGPAKGDLYSPSNSGVLFARANAAAMSSSPARATLQGRPPSTRRRAPQGSPFPGEVGERGMRFWRAARFSPRINSNKAAYDLPRNCIDIGQSAIRVCMRSMRDFGDRPRPEANANARKDIAATPGIHPEAKGQIIGGPVGTRRGPFQLVPLARYSPANQHVPQRAMGDTGYGRRDVSARSLWKTAAWARSRQVARL
jgi:hypothetical protein